MVNQTKLLLVDDDLFVRNIYIHKFRLEGFIVEGAADGEQALTLAESFHPDAIVLDLQLPKLNGVEVLRRLRAMPATAKLPILVLSSSYLTNLIELAWQAGATKCLSKTDSNPKLVVDMIRELIAASLIKTDNRSQSTNPSPQVSANPAPLKSPIQAAATSTAPTSIEHYEKDDRSFRLQVAAEFAANGLAVHKEILEMSQGIIRTRDEPGRIQLLSNLSRKVHTLADSAAVSETFLVARLASALEVLLSELRDKPASITPSTLRTMAQTIDFLGKLLHDHQPGQAEREFNPLILVVDDDTISRRAVVMALSKVGMLSVNLGSPELALTLLKDNSFDLATFDIDMPGMNGMELCKQMHAIPRHAGTPAVFVTSMGDFQNRAQSALSGGSDFIAKPFLFIELTLKVLIHLIRRRLENQAKLAANPISNQGTKPDSATVPVFSGSQGQWSSAS